jgi:hypothetical protein
MPCWKRRIQGPLPGNNDMQRHSEIKSTQGRLLERPLQVQVIQDLAFPMIILILKFQQRFRFLV